MFILLIDTAHPEVRVVLAKGEQVLGKKQWTGDQKTGVTLLAAIEELLQKEGIVMQDIGRVAVHGGPGHYSALRTGVVTADILAWAGRGLPHLPAKIPAKPEISGRLRPKGFGQFLRQRLRFLPHRITYTALSATRRFLELGTNAKGPLLVEVSGDSVEEMVREAQTAKPADFIKPKYHNS